MRVLTEGQIERLFGILNQSSELIQKSRDQSYLDSLIETLGAIQNGDDNDQGLSSADEKKLINIYAAFDQDDYDRETIRKAIRMAFRTAIWIALRIVSRS
ncbi:hypothetical protein GKC44_14375 [Lactobacillus parabuchneri]|uniref:YtxK-like N-terminal helical domain-containing protein n=1 Tax=Lentilactobacillus parabuchneri TaxID=152331 RepID=A0A844EP90_9LACO|nr:hypothetical protein [Lentilactobacillus parabuchneri]